MADIKITSDVAGRVCELLLGTGATVANGDDIALVEAMKMEIPVASTVSGKIKSVLVSVDDMVAEGQTIAVIET
ncbi:acetyl-CoA carboxylase biotin carboxyl carrier protein subunit [Bradyrhizobium prioriisuperbiae]|uniref:acetyl-CoA carboxylase biotin carboxyl carrier protein subunit n=1 Tax=Bradyrhizobium prioriisuperbiae TaxID=2854389 RepID=UPI0028E24060|nr:acetyl-CoA carboxylase biotin carboxyl carrier protein subunit [Bradyrhizobium prioritasuperba]